MINFITEHYLIIMIVSLFLIFALIGYIIDSSRNKKRGEDTTTFDEVEDAPIVEETPIIEEEPIVEEVKEETAIPEIEEPEDNA